ncbi:50S ribosomal protein L36 [Candidatus Nomurabacteria bacterium RIFCSPLOWO2_01_FULL_36_10b]|uniref:Large ribosomal subunit protein bL36 n=1 Tax=Candidatus Nomurabacteria bacterium RIFCSPLOWO2_01_FULL_36_10b TaxID=1801766 RepID=A0A1F6WNU0_9BACT|nr:MAG: 50S ribosomal protein L36 [Candidatus Nomurabacteria bacterium RIFCSPLOWO2_01_FULL_36_10b]
MRVVTSIPKRRLKRGQKIVRRRGRLFLIDKANPRNKSRQK